MSVPLEPDKYYHIYNHANGSDDLFRTNDNYCYFLDKYAKYINPITDTFTYCLMPNHFHFSVRFKSVDELEALIKSKISNSSKTLSEFQTLTGLDKYQFILNYISQQYSHLFNGYTQAYNKQLSRTWSLFNRPFKRKAINEKKYFLKLVHYIHYNPVEHGFCEKIEDWNYSSYNTILSQKPTALKRKEVIEWFGDIENFIYCHKHRPNLTGLGFIEFK